MAQNTFIRTGKWPNDGRNSRFPSVEAFDLENEIKENVVREPKIIVTRAKSSLRSRNID